MKVICSGRLEFGCDPTCIHSSIHEEHINGCMCEDCNVTQDPAGGVGCVNDDTCIEINQVVRCIPWWESVHIERLYAIGQGFTGKAVDGQKDGWMLEGLFKTEKEAIENCKNDDFFVVPVPIGFIMGTDMPDGLFWPRLQSKEEGQARLEAFRKGEL